MPWFGWAHLSNLKISYAVFLSLQSDEEVQECLVILSYNHMLTNTSERWGVKVTEENRYCTWVCDCFLGTNWLLILYPNPVAPRSQNVCLVWAWSSKFFVITQLEWIWWQLDRMQEWNEQKLSWGCVTVFPHTLFTQWPFASPYRSSGFSSAPFTLCARNISKGLLP